MKRLQGFILGVLVSLIVVASIPTFADSIAVVINGINITINGKKIASINQQFTLDNGSTVPYSIVYKGTTYLPMKKLAELLNKDITWDNSTKTAGIYEKGTAPVSVTSGTVTQMGNFAIKINGKYYQDIHGSTNNYLFYDSTGHVYMDKSHQRSFSLVYMGCIALLDSFCDISPSKNSLLDYDIAFVTSETDYMHTDVTYEYDGLNKITVYGTIFKSKDMSKEIIIKQSQINFSITSGEGNNLLKYVSINGTEYIDITYVLNYLGFDGKAYYDSTKKFNVFEVL